MKSIYFLLVAGALAQSCTTETPKAEKKATPSDSLLPVEETPTPAPENIVVQIGAFKKQKGANSRASSVSGTTILDEDGLHKVVVTVSNPSDVESLKQQMSGEDRPFVRR